MTRNVSPYCIIENVVTEQELRNQGLGKAIIKHALDFAWKQGCYKVMLQTGSKRESTHNFYKSCGFRADDKFTVSKTRLIIQSLVFAMWVST
jgi:GNAT superfamily N-acetyltransferase